MKRLKNTEDKNEKHLKATNNRTENIKEITDFVEEPLSLKVKGLRITKHLKSYLESFITEI